MDRWEDIFLETNLCVPRNQRLNWVEIMVSPPRRGLNSWAQVQASQQEYECMECLLQVSCCPMEFTQLPVGETSTKGMTVAPRLALSAVTRSRAGRGWSVMGRGVREVPASLGWSEKGLCAF